jgi:hypothetical protein
MDQELLARIDALSQKVEETRQSVEQLKRYFLWALIISVAVIVLPLIGMLFAIPRFLSTYDTLLTF